MSLVISILMVSLQVVCGKCSSHRMFLRYDMSEVQRVCHCCYSVLHMQRQNTT